MYYFKYVVEGTKDFITIATTRPETMFVDAAVFVNPKDKRYKQYVGKYVINPVNGQKLEVYQDNYVDMKFGTGAMKCTPAHDFNDYELAFKHKITGYKSVISDDGTLNELAKSTQNSFADLDRLVARDGIVADIQANNLLIKVENHNNKIGYSERTGEVIEPLLSEQ
jgi:valyl-tRNA synthetase